MKNHELVEFLTECGVCNICQLRYLKGFNDDSNKDIKLNIESLNVSCDEKATVNVRKDDEHISKKCRTQCCPTCLGLFSKQFQDQLISRVVNCSNIKNYDCPKVVVAICLPVILQIQQLSMWYACLERFNSNIISIEKPPDMSLKEMIKLLLNPIICKRLEKEYEPDCGSNGNGIIINIILKHNKESEELVKLQQLHEKVFPRMLNTKKQIVSRGLFDKQYTPKRIAVDLFKEFFPVPPMTIMEDLYLESIQLTGPTIYIAGRYCKISRELSHTPWILNGKRIMDDSIEEIINRAIVPYFCNEPSKAIFMSSGREDVDVRCLGKGRPFVLEIPNAYRTQLTQSEAYRMECDIDKSLKVSVRNIQMVKRNELIHIKSGEEQKRKFYRALCILTETAVTDEILKKLDIPQGFHVIQKTPIRVLHRRPLHSRPRTVHSLKAYVQKGNRQLLILDIISQAGTYIKELVHGEFGRTEPSIYSIIEQPIDIIALDVMAIDLDWPQYIDNSSISKEPLM